MSGTGKSAGATCAEYLHSSRVGLRLSQEYVFVRNISFLAASRISGCLVTSVSGQTQIHVRDPNPEAGFGFEDHVGV